VGSVLGQTLADYEIIVVDDGSKDNTRQVLQPYLDRIHYIHQDNAGVAAARNTGISAARGDWLAFLDSDDTWHPQKLALQMASIKQTGVGVCFTNVAYTKGSESAADVPRLAADQLGEEKIDEPLELLLDDARKVYVQTMLVEKSLLEHVGCFDEQLAAGEDTRVAYRLALQSPFVYINAPLVMVERSDERQGLTNSSVKTRRERCDSAIEIIAEAYFRSRQKSNSTLRKLRRKLGYYLAIRAIISAVDGHNAEARRFARDGWYFGGDLKTRMRCLAAMCWPGLVKRTRAQAWK